MTLGAPDEGSAERVEFLTELSPSPLLWTEEYLSRFSPSANSSCSICWTRWSHQSALNWSQPSLVSKARIFFHVWSLGTVSRVALCFCSQLRTALRVLATAPVSVKHGESKRFLTSSTVTRRDHGMRSRRFLGLRFKRVRCQNLHSERCLVLYYYKTHRVSVSGGSWHREPSYFTNEHLGSDQSFCVVQCHAIYDLRRK